MIEIFLLLIAFHFIADYPLQGEFLAKAKNRQNPIPGVPWYQALIAHSSIHGLFVGLITGSILLALCETIAHAIIDDAKCAGRLTYNKDQFLHFFCKLIWAFIFVMT
jgi:hypothetical protein